MQRPPYTIFKLHGLRRGPWKRGALKLKLHQLHGNPTFGDNRNRDKSPGNQADRNKMKVTSQLSDWVQGRAMLLWSTTLVKIEKPREAKRLRKNGQDILEEEINSTKCLWKWLGQCSTKKRYLIVFCSYPDMLDYSSRLFTNYRTGSGQATHSWLPILHVWDEAQRRGSECHYKTCYQSNMCTGVLFCTVSTWPFYPELVHQHWHRIGSQEITKAQRNLSNMFQQFLKCSPSLLFNLYIHIVKT